MFYPILRNALNIPGVKDPADILSKLDYRSVHAVLQQFQDYLASSSEALCSEQAYLGTRIRDVTFFQAKIIFLKKNSIFY